MQKKGGGLELTRSEVVSKGYVMQAVQEIAHSRELSKLVPVKPTEYSAMMRAAKKRELSSYASTSSNSNTARFVKSDEWVAHTELESEKISMYMGN